MGGRNKTEKEESAIAKKVNKNLVLNVNSSNTDRPVNPTVDSVKGTLMQIGISPYMIVFI